MKAEPSLNGMLSFTALAALVICVLACTSFSPDDSKVLFSTYDPEAQAYGVGLYDRSTRTTATLFVPQVHQSDSSGGDPALIRAQWLADGRHILVSWGRDVEDDDLDLAVLPYGHVGPTRLGWFLWLHGVFLAAMAPCGLHWIGNGPEARTISGLVFGAAVVLFLTLWPMTVFGIGTGSERVEPPPASGRAVARGLSRLRIRGRAGAGAYVIGLGAAAVVVPVVCDSGGVIAAGVLAAGIMAGAVILALLVVWNLLAAVWRAAHLSRA